MHRTQTLRNNQSLLAPKSKAMTSIDEQDNESIQFRLKTLQGLPIRSTYRTVGQKTMNADLYNAMFTDYYIYDKSGQALPPFNAFNRTNYSNNKHLRYEVGSKGATNANQDNDIARNLINDMRRTNGFYPNRDMVDDIVPSHSFSSSYQYDHFLNRFPSELRTNYMFIPFYLLQDDEEHLSTINSTNIFELSDIIVDNIEQSRYSHAKFDIEDFKTTHLLRNYRRFGNKIHNINAQSIVQSYLLELPTLYYTRNVDEEYYTHANDIYINVNAGYAPIRLNTFYDSDFAPIYPGQYLNSIGNTIMLRDDEPRAVPTFKLCTINRDYLNTLKPILDAYSTINTNNIMFYNKSVISMYSNMYGTMLTCELENGNTKNLYFKSEDYDELFEQYLEHKTLSHATNKINNYPLSSIVKDYDRYYKKSKSSKQPNSFTALVTNDDKFSMQYVRNFTTHISAKYGHDVAEQLHTNIQQIYRAYNSEDSIDLFRDTQSVLTLDPERVDTLFDKYQISNRMPIDETDDHFERDVDTACELLKAINQDTCCFVSGDKAKHISESNEDKSVNEYGNKYSGYEQRANMFANFQFNGVFVKNTYSTNRVKITVNRSGLKLSKYSRGKFPFNVVSLKDPTQELKLPEFAEVSKDIDNNSCLQFALLSSCTDKNKRLTFNMKDFPSHLYYKSNKGFMSKSNKQNQLVEAMEPFMFHIKNQIYNKQYKKITIKFRILSLDTLLLDKNDDGEYTLGKESMQKINNMAIATNKLLTIDENNIVTRCKATKLEPDDDHLVLYTSTITYRNHAMPYPRSAPIEERYRLIKYIMHDSIYSKHMEPGFRYKPSPTIMQFINNFKPPTITTEHKVNYKPFKKGKKLANLAIQYFCAAAYTPFIRTSMPSAFDEHTGHDAIIHYKRKNTNISLTETLKFVSYAHLFRTMINENGVHELKPLADKINKLIKTISKKKITFACISDHNVAQHIERLLNSKKPSTLDNIMQLSRHITKYINRLITIEEIYNKLKFSKLYPDVEYKFELYPDIKLFKIALENQKKQKQNKSQYYDINRELDDSDFAPKSLNANPDIVTNTHVTNMYDKNLPAPHVYDCAFDTETSTLDNGEAKTYLINYKIAQQDENFETNEIYTNEVWTPHSDDAKNAIQQRLLFIDMSERFDDLLLNHIDKLNDNNLDYKLYPLQINVFAHNWAHFDGPLTNEAVISVFRKFALQIQAVNLQPSDPVKLQFLRLVKYNSKNYKYKIVFKDSYKICPKPLSIACSMFSNMPAVKQPMNHDYLSKPGVLENIKNEYGEESFKAFCNFRLDPKVHGKMSMCKKSLTPEVLRQQYYNDVWATNNAYVQRCKQLKVKWHLQAYLEFYCEMDNTALISFIHGLRRLRFQETGFDIYNTNTQASIAYKTLTCCNLPKGPIEVTPIETDYDEVSDNEDEEDTTSNVLDDDLLPQIDDDIIKVQPKTKPMKTSTPKYSLTNLHKMPMVKGHAQVLAMKSITGGQCHINPKCKKKKFKRQVPKSIRKQLEKMIKRNEQIPLSWIQDNIVPYGISVMDAASLYPSAMILIDGLPAGESILIAPGNDKYNFENEVRYAKRCLNKFNKYHHYTRPNIDEHIPWDETLQNIDTTSKHKYAKGRFILQMKITNIQKRRVVPMFPVKADNDSINWSDDPEVLKANNEFVIGDVYARMLINEYNLSRDDYEIKKILLFSQKDYSIGQTIHELFKKRQKVKMQMNHTKNKVELARLDALQEIYKVDMNSFYGRLNMKDRGTRTRYISRHTYKDAHLLKKVHANYDDLLFIEEYTTKVSPTYHHVGSAILDMSKAIMVQFHNIIQEMKGDIYYTDTDSFYTDTSNLVEIFSNPDKYPQAMNMFKVNGETSKPGQVDCDFPGDSVFSNDDSKYSQIMQRIGPFSIKSIFIEKKTKFCKILRLDENGEPELHSMITAKGINNAGGKDGILKEEDFDKMHKNQLVTCDVNNMKRTQTTISNQKCTKAINMKLVKQNNPQDEALQKLEQERRTKLKNKKKSNK